MIVIKGKLIALAALFMILPVSYMNSEYVTIERVLYELRATDARYVILGNVPMDEKRFDEFKRKLESEYESDGALKDMRFSIVTSKGTSFLKFEIEAGENAVQIFDSTKRLFGGFDDCRIFLNVEAKTGLNCGQDFMHALVKSKVLYECRSNVESKSGFILKKNFQKINQDINFQTVVKDTSSNMYEVIIGIPSIEILY